MSKPAISVIIPAYNVEKWLKRAVDSILDQTLTDIEVLIVDDGSTDDTSTLVDELAEKDGRVKAIHQQNAGAAAARNAAIAKSCGKYLYFMDGDDWTEPSMLGDMLDFAEKNDLQLVVCGYYIDTYYGKEKYYRELRTAPDVVYASQADFRAHAHELFDSQLLYAPWNKLYLASYIKDNNIVFPATFWDDLPFNLDVIRNIERVGCMDERYYHFIRARAESENTKYRPDMYDKREEEDLWLIELFEQWEIKDPRVDEFLARRYAERLLGCIENVTCKDCSLSSNEQYAVVDAMINAPRAKEALQLAEPTSSMMAQLFKPMRDGNASMVLLQSRFISFVKRNFTSIFARLKANR